MRIKKHKTRRLSLESFENRCLLATLANGEELLDSIVIAGNRDGHTFDAAANDLVRVSVGQRGDLLGSPVLAVFDPAGQLVDVDATGSNDAQVQFVAPSSGTYDVVVSEDNDDAPLDYRIRVIAIPDTPQLISNRDAALTNGQEVETGFPLGTFNVHPIEVTTGDLLQVAVGEINSFGSPVLQIVDPLGQSVAYDQTGSNDAFAQITAEQTGTYVAIVGEDNNDAAMEYRIRAFSIPDTPQLISGRDATLANGQEVESSIPLGSFNVHPIEVTTGDLLQVAVGEIASDGSPVLQIVDPLGQSVAYDQTGSNDAFAQITAEQTGTYVAIVGEDNNDAAMEYRIRAFSIPDTPQLISGRDAALANGQEVESSIPLGSFNVHPIEVTTGDLLQVAVGEIASDGSPVLQIVDPLGQSVAYDQTGSNDAFAQITAEQTGTYVAIVGEDNNDAAMEYRIRAFSIPDTPQLISGRDATLANGQEVESSIPLGSFNVHPIEVTTGDLLQVAVGEIASDGSPVLQIVDPLGQSVAYDQTGSNDAFAQITAEQTGTYVAIVGEDNNDAALEYRIRAFSIPDTPQLISGRDATLANGQEVESSIPLGSFNVHPIEVTTGDLLQVAVGEIASDGSPVLQIVDPLGQSVAYDQTGSNDAFAQIIAEQTGTYVAIVGEDNNDAALEYRIRAFSIPDTPQLISGRDAALANGQEVESSIPLGSFNVHPIEVTTGDFLQVSVGEIASDGSPVLQIVDPLGQSVAYDGTGSNDAALYVTAEQTGTYVAIVGEDNNDAALDYRIRTLVLPGTPQLIDGRDLPVSVAQGAQSQFPLGSFNVHPLTLDPGDQFDVHVVQTGDMSGSPVVSIFDTRGRFLGGDTTGSDESFVSARATVGGVYTVVVEESGNDTAMEYMINLAVVPDTTPPTVVDVLMNVHETNPADLPEGPQPTNWQTQRSQIRSMTVVLDEWISDEAIDLTFTNLGVDADNQADQVVVIDPGQISIDEGELTVSFVDSPLADGVYELELTIGDLAGNVMPNAYELTGDQSNGLFQLRADWDGDGGVGIFDFATFAYWFGQSVPRAPRYVDLNGDNGISIFDFSAFSAAFSSGIDPPRQGAVAPPPRPQAKAVQDPKVEHSLAQHDAAMLDWLREWGDAPHRRTLDSPGLDRFA